MSQPNFNMVLGCEKHDDGHIDINEGIFGVLDEKLKKIGTGIVILARNNTECRCRRTSKCSVECPWARSGIQSGHIISYQRKGIKI